MGSDVKKRRPIEKLTPEESGIAARFHRDAMRLCVWLWRKYPTTAIEQVMSAGHMGLLLGARSAADRLGEEPDAEALRAHMMRNVAWRVRSMIRNRIVKARRRGAESLFEDAFEDATATVPHRPDRLSPEDLADLAEIRRAFATLPDRERFIVEAHARGLTFYEGGTQMGMSKQGAHQLHSRAMARLRHRLGAS